jgi:hypothetical protein
LLGPSKVETVVNLSNRECLEELFGTAPALGPSSAACTSTHVTAKEIQDFVRATHFVRERILWEMNIFHTPL